MTETCDHGVTLEGVVETCAECKAVLSHRPSEEASLRAQLATQAEELARLRAGDWTAEERKHFLYEATKASYAEGVRAGCEELAIHAADMDEELDELRTQLTKQSAVIEKAHRFINYPSAYNEEALRDALATDTGERGPVDWQKAKNDAEEYWRGRDAIEELWERKHATDTTDTGGPE
jgi:hypothetical protein